MKFLKHNWTMRSYYTLKLNEQVAMGPTETDAALVSSARLLLVERPFRLVCPKYSATRHQRKMYRQPGERERMREEVGGERERVCVREREKAPRGASCSAACLLLAGESAKWSVARHPSVCPRQWNYPRDQLKTRFSGSDLNVRSRSTATQSRRLITRAFKRQPSALLSEAGAGEIYREMNLSIKVWISLRENVGWSPLL